MPVQEVIVTINSTINSILSCSLVCLFAGYNSRSATPTKKNSLVYETCNINFRNSFDFSYIIIFYLYSWPIPAPIQCIITTGLQSWTILCPPCIYPEKFIMSQQASKVASLTHAVGPHAPISLFLLDTTCYTQLQEREQQDFLGTIYNRPSEIML